MGLLGDIYSTIDSKKRQLKGLLADPVETLKLGLLNFKNDQNALLDTQAQAYSFIPRTQDQQARIPTFTRTQEQARKELADQGANMGMAAATVWHGSPHKFDKFDSSKIGTGEGAQAYGHGLYLADSQDVAKSYLATGQAAKAADRPTEMVARAIDASGGDEVAARAWLQNRLSTSIPEYKELYSSALKGFDSLKPQGSSLYKVDLPDEHIAKMLDWDKPLSEQPPEVQKALASIANGKMTGEQAWKAAIRESGNPLSRIAKKTGQIFSTPQEAADNLQRLGIPGIRYLDGGSRAGGAGTSNYVVFPGNEGLLTILERNGQGLLGQ